MLNRYDYEQFVFAFDIVTAEVLLVAWLSGEIAQSSSTSYTLVVQLKCCSETRGFHLDLMIKIVSNDIIRTSGRRHNPKLFHFVASRNPLILMLLPSLSSVRI